MGYATVIVSFITCLSLNVLLNSFDVYSDITLAFNTLTFNLGDSILLSGCRVCYGKVDKDVFSYKNKSSQQCLTRNRNFLCGRSYEFLNIYDEFQKSDECKNESLSFEYNLTSKSYIFKNEKCDHNKDLCCLENTLKRNVPGPLDHLDQRIVARHTSRLRYKRNKLKNDTYLLSGKTNLFHCGDVLNNYFNWSELPFYNFVNNDIKTLGTQNKSEILLKFIQSNNGKVSIVHVNEFTFQDECGILIVKKQDFLLENSGSSCGHDSCLVHLQYLKRTQNISNIDDWKQNTFYTRSIKYGGKTCQLLWQYGLATLVPTLLNFIFHLLLYLEDVKLGQVYKSEILFVICQFYPQWQTIKFLFNYICDKDESRLNKEKDHFDSQVGLLEPFLESSFQVSRFYFIFILNPRIKMTNFLISLP